MTELNQDTILSNLESTIPTYGIPSEDYKRLSSVDLSAYARVKQNLTYIPWGVSLQVMKTYDSTLDVTYVENPKNDSIYFGNENIGFYLLVYLTRNGERISENLTHAVRDYRNKAVKTGLDITHITNSLQRAIAKCVAINTGIGMTLYSQIDESIDFITDSGKVISDKAYLNWKSPADAISWAVSLGFTEDEANDLMKNVVPDAGGKRSKPFFYACHKAKESKTAK